jgi:hypothetical protein
MIDAPRNPRAVTAKPPRTHTVSRLTAFVVVWALGVPLAHGVAPWAISQLSRRYGWESVGPGPWNFLGLVPIALGIGGLAWIMIAASRESPKRIELRAAAFLMTRGPYALSRNPRAGSATWRAVRQTLSCEPKPGGLEQGQREPEQRRELLDASPPRQDRLPELRLHEVRHIPAEHDRRRSAELPTRRRARNAEIRRDGQLPGASDEIPSPMVVAWLRPGRGRHADDHRQFARAAQLLEGDAGRHRRDDNSRGKVQNVRGDSSGFGHDGAGAAGAGESGAGGLQAYQQVVRLPGAPASTPDAVARSSPFAPRLPFPTGQCPLVHSEFPGQLGHRHLDSLPVRDEALADLLSARGAGRIRETE